MLIDGSCCWSEPQCGTTSKVHRLVRPFSVEPVFGYIAP
jgi:hypothetical protein